MNFLLSIECNLRFEGAYGNPTTFAGGLFGEESPEPVPKGGVGPDRTGVRQPTRSTLENQTAHADAAGVQGDLSSIFWVLFFIILLFLYFIYF